MSRIGNVCMAAWLLLLAVAVPVRAQSYDKLWKRVEQAEEKNLPKTVMEVSDAIYRKALAEQNAGQMMKAYLWREEAQYSLTPDSLYSTIGKMEHWAQTEENAVNRAVLHVLLARLYLAASSSVAGRTEGVLTPIELEDAPKDMREWTGNIFVWTIDRHLQQALADAEVLAETPSADYVPLVKQGKSSRYYGHDLYHVLLGYSLDDVYGNLGFTDSSDSLAQARVDSLLRTARTFYAGRRDGQDAALLFALRYASWQLNISQHRGDDKQTQARYEQTLDSLMVHYADRPICAEVYIWKAAFCETHKRPSEALRLCDEGLKRYASYERVDELKNIRERILNPNLSVSKVSGAYPGQTVDLNVSYRNLSGFTAEVYASTLSPSDERNSYRTVNSKEFRKYAGKRVSSVHYDLSPRPHEGVEPVDWTYLDSDTLLKLPVPEEVGVYLVRFIGDGKLADFGGGAFGLQSSRLKMLSVKTCADSLEVAVLDAMSGQPVSGAEVQLSWTQAGEGGRAPVAVSAVTGDDGKVCLDVSSSYYVDCTVQKDGDAARDRFYTSWGKYGADRPANNRLTLLTDRAIYRPGQTVYVKGIAYSQNTDSAWVRTSADFELLLLDANRQEVASQAVRTNEFGSFSARLVLPSSCLNGVFTLTTRGGEASRLVRVEEYKRPSFEITFDPIAVPYRLGDRVTLTGQVSAYSGAAVQGVPLSYVVTRSDGFYRPSGKNSALEADTVRLDSEGRFAIPLWLRPGDVEGDFYTTFKVEVTVSDGGGETQTATTQLATRGNVAYAVGHDVPSVLCRDDSLRFTFTVDNLARIPQDVQLAYRIVPSDGKGSFGQEAVLTGTVPSNRPVDCSAWAALPSGSYGVVLTVQDSLTNDKDGKGDCRLQFTSFSRSDKRLGTFNDIFLYAEHSDFDASHPAVFYFGTSHKNAYVLMDVFAEDRRLESRTLQISDSLVRFELPYREAFGRAVSVQFHLLKHGELYGRTQTFSKRLPDRTLRLKWSTFRDRLLPGQQEEWRLTVETPQGASVPAELLATMYDASLDKLYANAQELAVTFPSYYNFPSYSFSTCPVNTWYDSWSFDYRTVPDLQFDALELPPFMYNAFEVLIMRSASGATRQSIGSIKLRSSLRFASPSMNMKSGVDIADLSEVVTLSAVEPQAAMEEVSAPAALPELVGLRTNFAETAFFYPHLRTDSAGAVSFSFTVPQSLTRWNFRGYAHTRDMLTGLLEGSTVTAKDFMLRPNLPRFVRVGDDTQVAATVTNLTGSPLRGIVTLTLFDPETERVISTDRARFRADTGADVVVSFRFRADERYSLLGVRLVADGDTFSDGEQHLLPVLSDKQYLTETQLLSLSGSGTRTFALDSLFDGHNPAATQRRLTVELTGNAAWMAVQALPTLAEPCRDDVFSWASAYYANALAAHIVASQPRIKTVMEAWRATGQDGQALHSQLEKNQELKDILLAESPWVLDAADERASRQRIASLFDDNLMRDRVYSSISKLQELQNADGSWSWFPGMSGSFYTTSGVARLLLRLPVLTGEEPDERVTRLTYSALGYLHREVKENYERALRYDDGERQSPPPAYIVDYLYLVAIADAKVPGDCQKAYRYYLERVPRLLSLDCIVCHAKAVTILRHAGLTAEADDFVRSLAQHVVQEEGDRGAHFAFMDSHYSWCALPIATHVAAMEALRLAGGYDGLLDSMRLWLLQQKLTTDWGNTVATADAVYALLADGADLLSDTGEARLSLGDEVVETRPAVGDRQSSDITAGLAYVKRSYEEGSPVLNARTATLEKATGASLTLGAVYAQFLVPMSAVGQQHDTPLSVSKQLYVERVAADGSRTLQAVGPSLKKTLKPGDKLVVRLTVRADRALEYVQLKDGRAACLEPVSVRSGYRFASSGGYYMEVDDAATNFFFDRLGKGVHVLEYSCRVVRSGRYQTGIATVQSVYAPQFTAHSAGGEIRVGD